MTKSKRNTYVDILKGLLMLSVVFGHTATALKAGIHFSCGPYPYIPYLRPFDMPLFMAIAGYFFYFSCCKRTWQEVLQNRTLMVLIPCMVWCWGGQAVRFGIYHHCSALSWLPGGLWFLWALLGCSALTLLLHVVLGKYGWMGAVALVAMSLLIGQDEYNIGYVFPFFFMGYLTSRLELIPRFRWWMGLLAIGSFAGCYAMLGTPFSKYWMVWDSHTYLFGPLGVQRHAELYLYRMTMGVFGSISFAWVVYLLCRCCRRLPEICLPCRGIYRFLLLLGEYSLAVYCIQSVLVETLLSGAMRLVVDHVGYNPLSENPAMFFAVILPCTVIAILLLCLAVHHGLSRREEMARVFFGK